MEERREADPSSLRERRTALATRAKELEEERKGYLRQGAWGLLSDAQLDELLAEVDGQREAARAELATVDEEVMAESRIEAARESLSGWSGYDPVHPVHPEWYEDLDALHPSEYLSLGASSAEERRRTYRRYGARFEVDGEGRLTLRLDLDLPGGGMQLSVTQLAVSRLTSTSGSACHPPYARDPATSCSPLPRTPRVNRPFASLSCLSSCTHDLAGTSTNYSWRLEDGQSTSRDHPRSPSGEHHSCGPAQPVAPRGHLFEQDEPRDGGDPQ